MDALTMALIFLLFIVTGLCCAMVVMVRNVRAQHVNREQARPTINPANVAASSEVRRQAAEMRSWASSALDAVREGKQ